MNQSEDSTTDQGATEPVRVVSITFISNGEEWIATVGKPLRGTKTKTRRRKNGPVEVTTNLSDGATVQAIQPGRPHDVYTDGRPLGPVVSAWENPFMVGEQSVRAITRA